MAGKIQTDKVLLERICKKSDMAAFDMLFRRYYPLLQAYASQFVDWDNAGSVVQDVMLYLWEKRSSINVRNSVSTFLYTAVKYNCLSLINRGLIGRKVMDSLRLSLIEEVEPVDFDKNVYKIQRRLDSVLEKLPEPQRIVFRMNRFEGLSYKKIASELGVSVKTVEYRMSQALEKLRDGFSDIIGK